MTYQRRQPCQRKCAGGRKCALDNDPQGGHEQCICNDPYCICHSAAIHNLERVTIRGVVQYRRVRTLGVPR